MSCSTPGKSSKNLGNVQEKFGLDTVAETKEQSAAFSKWLANKYTSDWIINNLEYETVPKRIFMKQELHCYKKLHPFFKQLFAKLRSLGGGGGRREAEMEAGIPIE